MSGLDLKSSGARISAYPHPLAAYGRRGAPWWLLTTAALALVATGVIGVTMSFETLVTGVATAFVFWMLGVVGLTFSIRENRRFAVHLFSAAFLARYVAAALILSVMAEAGETRLQGGHDYLWYEESGWRLASSWRAGEFVMNVSDPDPGYYYLVAAVYTFTGRHPIAPTLLNALFGGLSAVVLWLMGRELFDRKTGVIAGMLTAFVPNLLFWSSLLYKDTVLAFAVSWALLLAIWLSRDRTRRNAGMLAFALLPLFMMRPESAITVAAAGVLLALWAQGGLRLSRLLRIASAVVAVIAILLAVEAIGLGGKRGGLERLVNPIALVFQHREAWADVVGQQATGFSRFLYGRNLLLEPHLLLVATALPFILPVPGSGEFGLNFGTFQIPGQLVWIPLIPAMFYGGWWVLRHRTPPRVILLLFVVVSSVGIAVAGYFSNPRYLVSVIPLCLLFASVGVREIRSWWPWYGLTLSGAGSVLILYLLIRGL